MSAGFHASRCSGTGRSWGHAIGPFAMVVVLMGCGEATRAPLAESTAAASGVPMTTTIAPAIVDPAIVDPATAAIDSAMVGDCVDYTQFAAFTGDPAMLEFWNAANQDVEQLRLGCERLGVEAPDELARIAGLQSQLDAYFAAVSPTSVATTPPPAPLVAELPAAIPPPALVPLAQPTSSCNSNYSGACVPIAFDVDCAGGTGNGPEYVTGPVTVIGSDPYGLDHDDDGVGCE